MSDFFSALALYGFLQTAVLAGLLASVGCGVMGTYVVVKRIAFLAGGIAHSVLGGMGAAVYFGFDPLSGALFAAILSALLIGWVRLQWQQQEDTLISALWAIGMAVGILFISQTPGYQSDLMSYLFGNILMVSKQSLWLMATLDVLLILIVSAYHRQFLAVVFDEEFARLRGIPVRFFYLLLLVMVALTVVLLIQVVGLILVLALLTLPAAIAAHYVHSIGKMMLLSTLLGSLFSVCGLALSYQPDLPAGPSIILLAGAAYILSALFSHAWLRHKRRTAITQYQTAGGRNE
ncbi:MAG: metal ABC transporter permease [gamma proteobacterium symbiont of Bathyaustriella thionipta]|nr:metal ABC transporter permease [gamma proteobacterium symbiont of Bathyaustriella thionipta]